MASVDSRAKEDNSPTADTCLRASTEKSGNVSAMTEIPSERQLSTVNQEPVKRR